MGCAVVSYCALQVAVTQVAVGYCRDRSSRYSSHAWSVGRTVNTCSYILELSTH